MNTYEIRNRLSRLRQSLTRLNSEAAKLNKVFAADKPMIRGSVYEMKRKCGKTSCVCATQGKLHSSRVISWSEDGSTRLQMIPKGKFVELRILTKRYQRFKKARAQLIKIQNKMIEIIDQLEVLRRKEL